MRQGLTAGIAGLLLFGLTGCFTGIESTPRISGRDLKRHDANTLPAEARLLGDIGADSPLHPGQRLYVTSPRIALALCEPDGSQSTDSLAGQTLVVKSITSRPSINGDSITVYTLATPDSHLLEYRTNVPLHKLEQVRNITVPFTIDMDAVEAVRDSLVGRHAYILPQRRQTAEGADTLGLRYQPVTITEVLPGSENLPLLVFFETADGATYRLPMTMGQRSTATRNFETLFSLTDPRRRYADIPQDVWNLIVQSRVRLGMTPAQCRLALGAPDSYNRIPTTMGYVEQWHYANGTYLYFQDGMLERFRQ